MSEWWLLLVLPFELALIRAVIYGPAWGLLSTWAVPDDAFNNREVPT